MEKGTLGLTKFRTELCGKVIYVSLAKEGPSLEETLGPGYAIAQRMFAHDRRLFLTINYEVEANWKIKIENTLESYHIELIHPETFKTSPDEQVCQHELDPRFTTFTTSEPPPKKRDSVLNEMAHRIAGVPFKQEYKHSLYYPALTFVETGLVTIAESVFPLGPSRSKVLLKFFAYTGPPEKLRSRVLFRGLKYWGERFFNKVTMEDAGIIPSIQRGMESGQMPSEGLISIREERLNHFQDYVLRATSDDADAMYSEPREAAGSVS
jgi:phenylpropionate dioxygenase-like ring-hydroxylating dioxygenase large terminal subunit